MFRRLMILAVVSALFAALVQTALGVNVRVRVEGRTQTIFGMAEPTVSTSGASALDSLEAASARGEFYYHVTQFSFGPFVDQIGRYKAEGSNGWTFKVNGISPQVGADKVILKESDTVVWYWATFGPQGGPPTLSLDRSSPNCYVVFLQNDAGQSRPANGAVLLVDGRRRKTRRGRACIGRHRGLVRAVLAGAVRSNALR
ncbi:MAG: DUF4430 domain-containing protein [Actinobacteria bacterium]|nr:DUF4430 domain-containing protein [Actinomycetota bacterium]